MSRWTKWLSRRTPRIDQIVDTNRSRRSAGVHVYNPHLLDNRSTSSRVCKAGALLLPPSCLGGGPHGWVPVDTHSTPVLTSVRRLWVAYVVQEPNEPQEHAQPVHESCKMLGKYIPDQHVTMSGLNDMLACSCQGKQHVSRATST